MDSLNCTSNCVYIYYSIWSDWCSRYSRGQKY